MKLINSFDFEADSAGFKASGLYNRARHGIRGNFGALMTSNTSLTGGYAVSSQCTEFWISVDEHQKGSPNSLTLIRAGTPGWNSRFLNIDYSGNVLWKVDDSFVVRSGVDVGRWNHIYTEIDEENKRIGLSVNAEPKIFTPYSGDCYTYNPFQFELQYFNSHDLNIDELRFYSGTMSQDTLKDHYSNFLGYSYSGIHNTHWMYPQTSLTSPVIDTDAWYADKLGVTIPPVSKRWEYLNDVDDLTNLSQLGTYPNEDNLADFDGLFTDIEQAYLHLGFGKCHVRPSSVAVYTKVYLNDYAGSIRPTVSGIYSYTLYDNNSGIISSGENFFNRISVLGTLGYATVDGEYGYTTPCTVNDNSDLSNIYGIFRFKKFGGISGAGSMFVNNIRLLFSGTPIAYTGLALVGSGGIDKNSNIDLYTQAYSSGLRSTDLYMAGSLADSSGIPLYIYGAQPINSGVDLYMYGRDTRSSGVDLFIGGHIGLNSGVPLYMYGANTHTGSMNLFTKCEPIESSGGVGLFTFASDDPSIQGAVNLYLKTALASSVVGTMSLYTAGPDTGSTYANMPLFLENNTYNYGSVELFLQNAYQSGFKGLKLFVDGEGTLAGGLPYSDSMPLFIERTDGVQGGLSMFMQVNNGVGSGINMFTKGGTYASSGLDLSIPSTYSENSGVLKLMIRGY